jgi:hypothetical protein
LQVLPALQEECKQSASCAAATKHFAHCQEKVNAGEGFHGENCIEELYVLRCLHAFRRLILMLFCSCTYLIGSFVVGNTERMLLRVTCVT